MEKRHRVFVAINLPVEIKKELFLYSEKWPELPAKWTAKDNLHITLEFLGALTDEEIGEVCLTVKAVAERHKAFTLNLSKILYGPIHPSVDDSSEAFGAGARKIPKFLWAVGEKSEELSVLRDDLESSLTEKIRFVPENVVFAPHITMARIVTWGWKAIEPEERPQVDTVIDLPFSVESIEVMESEMGRGGPIYTVLESHSLQD